MNMSRPDDVLSITDDLVVKIEPDDEFSLPGLRSELSEFVHRLSPESLTVRYVDCGSSFTLHLSRNPG